MNGRPQTVRYQMRRVLPYIAIFVTSAVLLSSSAPAQLDQHEITLAYPDPANGIWGQIAKDLAKNALARGITINSVPHSEFGGHSKALKTLRAGHVEISALSGILLAREVEQFELLNLPFLVVSVEEARRVIGAVGKELGEFAAKTDLQVLGYTWVIGTFVSNGGCVQSVYDIKGAKIMDGPPQHRALFRFAGANPVPISEPEVYAALQAGLAGTGLFSIEFIRDSGISEITDCLTDPAETAAMVLPIILLARTDVWEGLDDSKHIVLQDLIHDLETAADNQIARAISDAAASYEKEEKSVAAIDKDALSDWREFANQLYATFEKEVDGGAGLLKTSADARERPH